MHIYRSWLPDAALEDHTSEQSLADMARQWSAKWFAREIIRPAGAIGKLPQLAASADGATWLVLNEELALAVPDSSRIAIASMMLDKIIDAAIMTDADHQVVADLATACLEDLCRRLAQMFRLPPDVRWTQLDGGLLPSIDRPRGCSLGVEPRSPILRFVVSTDLMIALIKSGLTMPAMRGSLAPVATGLAAQSVTISAMLGQCSLTLADMVELGEGDVLVFDRDSSSPLQLTIDATRAGVGRCTVEQSDDRFHLKLLEPLTR